MYKYTLDFKTDKVTDLWFALADREFLCFDKPSDVSVKINAKNKSTDKISFKSRARLISALNRIEDTLDYMNSIQLGSTAGKMQAFDFYNFINYECVVIDCIEKIAEIFDLYNEIKILKSGKKIFNQNGTDNDFVKYIRSLSSVHPLDTAGHPKYNGFENFHCSPRTYWDKSILDDRDLTVIIYDASTNEDDFITIGLKISNFVEYMNKWIKFIDTIIAGVKKYETVIIEDYKNILMHKKEDFVLYSDYISYLKSEYIKRGNHYQTECFDDYIKIFNVKVSNKENEHKLELYKNAIMLSLDFLSRRIQQMEAGKGETTGIKYDVATNYTELFIELHYPENLESNEFDIKYCLEKLVCKDNFWERMDEIKGWMNQYVVFSNKETYQETYALAMTALYLSSLNNNKCVLNRNIPNNALYREKVLSENDYNKLIRV